MEKWKLTCLQLCVIGFFLGFTPLSQFVFQLLTQYQGFSSYDVAHYFLPQFIYWNLALLFIFFLLIDMLRYKPLIILGAFASFGYHTTVALATEHSFLTLAAFFYGLRLSLDVAYFTYNYAKVDKDKYQKVTSYTRSSLLLGRFFGATLGQFLKIFNVLTIVELNYFSISTKVVAFIVAIFLPAVTTSIYFYQRNRRQGPNEVVVVEEEVVKFSWPKAKSLLFSHLQSAVRNKTVVTWSVWWILMQIGFRMVNTYSQPLWHYIEPERLNYYNGFAEAGVALFGACSSMLAGGISQENLEENSMVIKIIFCLMQGGLALIAGQGSLYTAYAMHILFGANYHFMMTMTSAMVAKNLVQDSFGLIFGINTWISLFFSFLFTVLVVAGPFYQLDPWEQYNVYGTYFFLLAVGHLVVAFVLHLRNS